MQVYGVGNWSGSYACDVALRRGTEQAAVLAPEPRGTFIPHMPDGAALIEIFVQHQWPCFLYTQMLLVL